MPEFDRQKRRRRRRLEWIITLAIIVPILIWMDRNMPSDTDMEPGYREYPIEELTPRCPEGYSEPVFRTDGTYRCYALPEGK